MRPARIIVYILASLLGLVIVAGVLFYFLAPHADLRTDEVRRAGADHQAMARGRRLLVEAAEAHGLAAWRRHTTCEVVAVDHWPGGGPWWPQPEQRLRSERLLGTFTSRVTLLGGPADGEVRGLQSWAPWEIPVGGGAARFLQEPRPDITFYLPTLQYFDELPFRLIGAGTVTWAGTATLDGRTYQRVLATWGGLAAHAGHDQYDVWIDEATGRYTRVVYTARDATGLAGRLLRPVMRMMAIGTMQFDDYREVDGVWLPFRQTGTLGRPEAAPSDGSFMHRLVIESVRFDSVDPAALRPDPDRPDPGDRKPSGAAG